MITSFSSNPPQCGETRGRQRRSDVDGNHFADMRVMTMVRLRINEDNQDHDDDYKDDWDDLYDEDDDFDLLIPALALACAPGNTSSWTHWPEWSKISSVTCNHDCDNCHFDHYHCLPSSAIISIC